MAYLIGTDEAGYGPNLGPLVITATAWRTTRDVRHDGLYELLADCVCRSPADMDDGRLTIADSKLLYQPGAGLQRLERGAATALRACGYAAATWRDVWTEVAGLDSGQLDTLPWHAGYDHDLPLACDRCEVDHALEQLSAGLAEAGLELLAIRCLAVFPEEFNRRVARFGNKASLLTYGTLELVRDLLLQFPEGAAEVSCDKHGGRNFYGPLLQSMFPDFLVEIARQLRDVSIYRWGPQSRRVEFRFVARGEQFLATALASMVSKYLRELAMGAFNAYWLRAIPGLRPTAGYPSDAFRFKQAISYQQQALGIPDGLLWRNC